METQTPSQNNTRIDVYALITERIIEQLEKGTVPWRRPWSDGGLPRNLFSKKYYRGINLILLSALGYEQNLFITFKQLKEIGGKVKQGERAVLSCTGTLKTKQRKTKRQPSRNKRRYPFSATTPSLMSPNARISRMDIFPLLRRSSARYSPARIS